MSRRKFTSFTTFCFCIAWAHGWVATSSAQAEVIGTVFNPANGHLYLLLGPTGWREAEADAVALGAHLATINDQAEQDFVWSTFGPDSRFQMGPLWIGLNDEEVEGTFVWSSGEPVTYTNWQQGEPNSHTPDEDYVAMDTEGFPLGAWDDYHYTAPGSFAAVVEMDAACYYLIVGQGDPGSGGSGVHLYDGQTGTFLASVAAGVQRAQQTILRSDGNLYIGGEVSNNVQRYRASDFSFVDVFASAGLHYIRDMAFSSAGDLYVSSNGNNRVLRYDGQTGQLIEPPLIPPSAASYGAHGIAFDSTGALFLAIESENIVYRYDGTWQNFASANGPRDVAFGPDGNLYVAEKFGDDVVRFTSNGAPMGPFAVGIQSPVGIAFGPDGNLYVASHAPDAYVWRFDGHSGAPLVVRSTRDCG